MKRRDRRGRRLRARLGTTTWSTRQGWDDLNISRKRRNTEREEKEGTLGLVRKRRVGLAKRKKIRVADWTPVFVRWRD